MSTNTFDEVCETIVERIVSDGVGKDELEDVKRDVCSEFSASSVPKNSEILKYADDNEYEMVRDVVQRKPVRTASGVSPVAIMTSPKLCPHGKCLYCPGGPASKFSSAQSYTGHEPAAARAEQNNYDPYGQVKLRLEQLRNIGHPVDKIELILMGGTMTARSHDYQVWFVKRALQAMNEYDTESEPNPTDEDSFAQDYNEYEFEYLEDVIARNETNGIRCIGITFETKPDWCGEEQIDRMLRLGGTKTEVGVQTTYERINREMHRGHGVDDAIKANKNLRDSGFKVGFHMMPGQPGMSKEMCLEDFRRIFNESRWKPDYLKIYPTLVVEGTRLYDMWHNGEFTPLKNDEAAELVADIMEIIPPFTRLQRVQRDIPADFIEAGVWKSNLRQLARKRLESRGKDCNCIRCREVGMNEQSVQEVEKQVMEYSACGGKEHFISYEDPISDQLIGFARLRFPDSPHRKELQNAALLRELHVYGSETAIGADSDEWQHKGFGQELMKSAETIARDNGFEKLSVISGIGAREYYRSKLGYHQDGPYVSKRL